MKKSLLMLAIVVFAGFAFAAPTPTPTNPYIHAKMLNFGCMITQVVFPMNQSITAMNASSGSLSNMIIGQMAALAPAMSSAATNNQTGTFNGLYAQMILLVNLERFLYFQTAVANHADFATLLSEYRSYQDDYADCLAHGLSPG